MNASNTCLKKHPLNWGHRLVQSALLKFWLLPNKKFIHKRAEIANQSDTRMRKSSNVIGRKLEGCAQGLYSLIWKSWDNKIANEWGKRMTWTSIRKYISQVILSIACVERSAWQNPQNGQMDKTTQPNLAQYIIFNSLPF